MTSNKIIIIVPTMKVLGLELHCGPLATWSVQPIGSSTRSARSPHQLGDPTHCHFLILLFIHFYPTDISHCYLFKRNLTEHIGNNSFSGLLKLF